MTQLRPSSSHDNWGGDETVSLDIIDTSLGVRIEWSEGKSDDWDIWCFERTADIQDGDVLLVEDDDLVVALMVERVTPTTSLKGRFHHYELMTTESELSTTAYRNILSPPEVL